MKVSHRFFGRGLFFSLLCLSIFAHANVQAREVLSREIGPASSNPLRGFNINRFDWNRASNVAVDCKALARTKKCPGDMEFVCSENFRIAMCMDRDLMNDPRTGRPQGNMNLFACQNACAQKGRRIPTNNEWLVGCTGSQPSACLNYGGSWPPGRFAQIPGHPCAIHGATSGACLTHPDLINELPPVSGSCVSEAGVRGCIGTFHQWVSGHFVGDAQHGGYRFNGGSYVVSASAVDYVTPAHTNDFYHYANGCRCADDLR